MDKENLGGLLSDDDLFDEDGWTKDDLGEWKGSIDEWEFQED